jgi:hypothetical protein
MMPENTRVLRRERRREWRGIPTGRRSTRKVETTYGRKQAEGPRLARHVGHDPDQRQLHRRGPVMTARTYVRAGNGGSDKVTVDPREFAVGIRVSTSCAGHSQPRPERTVPSDNPSRSAAQIGALLLADGYILTAGDQS